MTESMKIDEFLLARIAEDEERGRSLVMQWHDVGNACQSCGTDGARLLAECDAKRQIVQGYLETGEMANQLARADREEEAQAVRYGRIGLESALTMLALPYADHADYDEAWRP